MRTNGIAVPVAGALVAALISVALAACGSDTTAAPQSVASKAAPAKSGDPGSAERGSAPASTCETQVQAFVGSLDRLRRRLVAGVTYEQYVSEIEGIRSAYRAVPVEKLDVECLTQVGGPAESSFNTYIEAGNDWGDCVGTAGCEAATVEPVLQRRWRLAAKALSEAQAAM
jgi:hypothetical protein